MKTSWIGVDLDGTLAFYTSKQYPEIGPPIEPIAKLIRQHLYDGFTVRIFTARVDDVLRWSGPQLAAGDPRMQERLKEDEDQRKRIADWTEIHLGERLVATNCKDFGMIFYYDDRALHIERNVGKIAICEGLCCSN